MAISRDILIRLGALALGFLLATPLALLAQEQADEQEMSEAPAEPIPPGVPQPLAPFPPTGGAPASRLGIPVPTSPSPAGGAAAQPAQGLRPGEMMFNFQEADIQAVVKTVSQITGKNFLLDPRVKGKLTIISTQPVSKNAIYQIFLASLKAQGYTAVNSASGFIKLIPLGDAKQSANVTTGTMPRPGEQTITHVITVQHSSASQLVPLLRPLMAPTSQISVYPPANTLIITDYADNIRNLLRIVEIIDQRGGAEFAIIPLKHASALDIAEMVTRLYPNITQTSGVPVPAQAAAVGEADRVTILPDLRTNSLLVRAENQGAINDLRTLIEKLDVPARVAGNTRVVYLRNAEAVKLAEILRGLLTGEARAQAAPAVPGRPAVARTGVESSQIQADEATNSLIISASDAVFNNLRAVIEKLDIRRAQVYVEALIAEVTTDKASQFGFQWAAGGNAGSGTVGGIVNFPKADASLGGVAASPTSLGGVGGFSLAYLGKKITLSDGTEVRGLGALARALEEKSIGNILSAPNLLTLDNAEAKIVVGKNVPFVTGSFSQATGTGGTVNPFQTIERKDVGLTLKIKPQIAEGGTVKLLISQESSSVAQATGGVQAADLITNKRSLDTTVVVDDGNTIVLGGLIEDSISEITQAVPFLGRIPLLGWLFKYRVEQKTKTNLMVFLRPVIVRGPEDSYGFSSSRYAHIYSEQKKISKQPAPILEDFKPREPLPPGPSEGKKDANVSDEIPSDKIFGPHNVPDSTSRSDRSAP